MPEAELGVEQLVDELLQFIILQDSVSTSPNRPWKVVKYLVDICNLNRDLYSQNRNTKYNIAFIYKANTRNISLLVNCEC